jgi:hypothetical protein
MNLEHANKRLMAALGGIAAGKKHKDFVDVEYGQPSRIFNALNDAAHLQEDFHAEEFDTVDRALKKLNLACSSARKNEVAKAILETLIGKPARQQRAISRKPAG